MSNRRSLGIFFLFLVLSSTVAEPILVSQIVRSMLTAAVRASRSRRSVLSSFFSETENNELSEDANAVQLHPHSRTFQSAPNPFLQRTSSLFAILLALPLALPLSVPLALPLIALGGLYLISRLAPQMIPTIMNFIGPILAPILTVSRQYIAPIFGMRSSDIPDIHTIERTLQTGDLLERGFDYMNIRERDCRNKSFCEAGRYLRIHQPAVASAIDLFGSMLSRVTGYSGPLRRGVKGHDCETHFPSCTYSPMQRMFPWAFTATGKSTGNGKEQHHQEKEE